MRLTQAVELNVKDLIRKTIFRSLHSYKTMLGLMIAMPLEIHLLLETLMELVLLKKAREEKCQELESTVKVLLKRNIILHKGFHLEMMLGLMTASQGETHLSQVMV